MYLKTRVGGNSKLNKIIGMGMVFPLIALVLAFGMQGCGPQYMAPDETIKKGAAAIQEGKYEVVWDLFPASYQKDITEVVTEFGNTMDPDIWKQGTETLRKAVALFKAKKDLMIDFASDMNPQIAGQGNIDRQFDESIEFIEKITKSKILDLHFLKNPDIRNFMVTDLNALANSLYSQMDEPGLVPPNEQAREFLAIRKRLENLKVSVSELQADRAKVTIASEGETDTLTMVKVEGKWVPEDMAREWDAKIQQAHQKIQEMGKKISENRIQIVTTLTMANGLVDSLMAANSKEDFQIVLGQLLGGFSK